tara:strand:+ start:1451 stop:1780 length:330 start_codon:yes stop_codon:yes gene_type:complete
MSIAVSVARELPGFNDSRRNTSSIPNQSITFPEYPDGDSSWNQVMSGVRSMLSPFGIEVTDQDPGETPHTEIIACGQSFVASGVLGFWGLLLVAFFFRRQRRLRVRTAS